MRPRTIRIAAAAAAALAAVGLVGCGDAGNPTPASSTAAVAAASAAGSGRADARTAQQRAEDTFITINAAHLCTVQSTVYDNPQDMDAAYRSTPPYPGLDTAQIKQFQQRLTTDSAFAERLSSHLRQTCKPG